MLERKRGWALILSVAIMLCTVSVFLSSDVYARRDSGYDRPSYTISSFWERVIDRQPRRPHPDKRRDAHHNAR